MNCTSPKLVKPSPPTESLEASIPTFRFEPGQVLNRVGILAAGQPSYRDPPGIAVMLFRVGGQLARGSTRPLAGAARRSAAACPSGGMRFCSSAAATFSQCWKPSPTEALRGQLLKVHAPHLRRFAVALEAVLLECRRRVCAGSAPRLIPTRPTASITQVATPSAICRRRALTDCSRFRRRLFIEGIFVILRFIFAAVQGLRAVLPAKRATV